MFGIGKYFAIGGGIILAIVLAWGLRVDHLRAGWQSKFSTLSEQSGLVLLSVRNASDNPELKWADTATQVNALGTSLKDWKRISGEQTIKINNLGDEASRLKKLNAQLRAKADVLIAQRAKAITRLEDSASTPGDRKDCMSQITAVNVALDLIYEEGF